MNYKLTVLWGHINSVLPLGHGCNTPALKIFLEATEKFPSYLYVGMCLNLISSTKIYGNLIVLSGIVFLSTAFIWTEKSDVFSWDLLQPLSQLSFTAQMVLPSMGSFGPLFFTLLNEQGKKIWNELPFWKLPWAHFIDVSSIIFLKSRYYKVGVKFIVVHLLVIITKVLHWVLSHPFCSQKDLSTIKLHTILFPLLVCLQICAKIAYSHEVASERTLNPQEE